MADGYYLQTNNFGLATPNRCRVPIHTRNSADFNWSTDLTIVSIYWPHRIRSSSLPEDARLYNRNEDDISVGSLAGGAELEMQMKVAVSDFARSSWPTWTRELDEER